MLGLLLGYKKVVGLAKMSEKWAWAIWAKRVIGLNQLGPNGLGIWAQKWALVLK